MNFKLFDLKYRNPYLSLALDEALCLYFAEQKDFRAGVRVWAAPPSIVLGRTNKPEENVRPEMLDGMRIGVRRRPRSGEIFLCRRASGGGTVAHGPGNLNFSIFASLEKYPAVYPVRASYEAFLGLVSRALARTAGVATRMRGDSDLVLEAPGADETAGRETTARKISGNAQFRKRGVVVHHGTLLVGDGLAPLIRATLAHPPREPAYRAGRSHGDFLAALPVDFDAQGFFAALAAEVGGYFDVELAAIEREPIAQRMGIFKLARKLASDIYVSEDWIRTGKYPAPVADAVPAAARPPTRPPS